MESGLDVDARKPNMMKSLASLGIRRPILKANNLNWNRQRPRDWLERPWRRILLQMLMTNKYLHQWRPKDRLALPKRGDQIAPGNGKNTIGCRIRTTPTPKLWHSYVRTLPTWTRKLASLPFHHVTTIARQVTYTATRCTATVGAQTRVTYKISRSYVPLLSAVDVLVKQKLRRFLAAFTRNILLLRTKTTVPDSFPSTSKTLFARPWKLRPWTQRPSWSKMFKTRPPRKSIPIWSATWPASFAANVPNFSKWNLKAQWHWLTEETSGQNFLKPAE